MIKVKNILDICLMWQLLSRKETLKKVNKWHNKIVAVKITMCYNVSRKKYRMND